MADLDDKVKQLDLDINEVHMSLDIVPPKISEDALVPEAEPKDEPVDEKDFTGTMNPFEVFPDLVWLKISSKIQDNHDWLNLYFASPKLMGFLENEMYERIFPQVFTHLRKYLKRKDVINMCAADWKFESSIISWVQTRWLAPRWAGEGYDSMYYEKYSTGMSPDYSPKVHVENPEQIRHITNELLEGGSGSLIPFGIYFREWRDRNDGIQYWTSVRTFLQLFGPRVWFCKLQYDEEHIPNIIIQCLRLIPNVIRLGLYVPYLIPPAHSPRFPHLVKLKVLSLVQESHETLIDLLRLHADQLEYLSIEGIHDPEESFRYSNLKELHLTNCLMDIFPLRLDLFSQVPLRKIYTEVTPFGFAEFGRFFLGFNQFGASLQNLELEVNVDSNSFLDREENDMTWALNINLPKLKKLTIWSSDGDGEQLLLRMHSFQDSQLPFPDYEDYKDFFFASKGKKMKEIFDSDIWSILPKLQEVKFRNWKAKGGISGIYTRDEFNECHQKPPN